MCFRQNITIISEIKILMVLKILIVVLYAATSVSEGLQYNVTTHKITFSIAKVTSVTTLLYRHKMEDIYLDGKLMWRNRLEKTGEKAKRKLNVMKSLTGIKWCNAGAVLNAIYKAYVNFVLHYGCEALITATPAILNKLEIIQNQAPRLITEQSNNSACLYTSV
jgi:hypothetical protein